MTVRDSEAPAATHSLAKQRAALAKHQECQREDLPLQQLIPDLEVTQFINVSRNSSSTFRAVPAFPCRDIPPRDKGGLW